MLAVPIDTYLNVSQFTLNGRIVRWQKWTFHIGFNYREGTVISDVRYDGRKVFYRLSISDMVSNSRQALGRQIT
jgi:Cu2+-containing amine oxidase